MNIVMIIIDTLRYDYIANGNPGIHTPHMDRLSERSWNFDLAFAASYPTIPHRTDTITGRYGAPFHPWKPLDLDVPSIPRALGELGYCTQLIHDTPHLVNGGHRFDYPFNAWTPVRGAEVDRAWITDSWQYLANWASDPLFDAYPEDVETVLQGNHAIAGYVQTNHGRTKEEDWNVAQLFTKASKFLTDNAKRENFFLWIDSFDPHEPWDSPPEFVRMYEQTAGYDGRIDPRAFGSAGNDPSLPAPAIERIKAMYAAKVTFVDKWLGVFLDTLEKTGLASKTAILLTADHGTNVIGPEGRRFGKFVPPYQNEAHVPFLVHVPGGGSGRCSALVQPQDTFATIMGIAGGKTPDGIESHDMLKLAEQGASGPRQMALAGASVGKWPEHGADKVLFSAFNAKWHLGFATNPAKCVLHRLGSYENVAADNPDTVKELRRAAIDEIARRGLDPTLVDWLKSNGEGACPADFRATDAHPAPKAWTQYWSNLYRGE